MRLGNVILSEAEAQKVSKSGQQQRRARFTFVVSTRIFHSSLHGAKLQRCVQCSLGSSIIARNLKEKLQT